MVRDVCDRAEETNPLITMKAVTAVEHLTFAQCYLSNVILFFLIKIMPFLLLKPKQIIVIPVMTHA